MTSQVLNIPGNKSSDTPHVLADQVIRRRCILLLRPLETGLLCLTRMTSRLGPILVVLCLLAMHLSSTSLAELLMPEEVVAMHSSVHTLVVNASIDILCRQHCSLIFHALENEQRGGSLEGPVQLQGNATLLEVNTVNVSQLPAATYRLTVSCSNGSECSSRPTFLHFSKLPSGAVAATGFHARAAAAGNLPQVQVLESSFWVAHGHGMSAISTKEQPMGRKARGKKWLQGILVFSLLTLQVSSLVLS